jgi:hypothetical protein
MRKVVVLLLGMVLPVLGLARLQQYVGTAATAWLVPSGSEFQVTRIDVTGQGTGASTPDPAPAVSSPSTLTVILGALAVGALGYVIGRNSASQTVNPPAYPDYYGPGNQYGPAYQYGLAYQYGGDRWSPGDRQRYYYQCGPQAWSQGCPNRADRH